MPMTDVQLAALEKLRILAAAKEKELIDERGYAGSFHDEEIRMLSCVPNWIHHAVSSFDNQYSKSVSEDCLRQLRRVAWYFKFNLK
jgi:hypothetical protein